MPYGAVDHHAVSDAPTSPNLHGGDESDLTPLSSEDEDESGYPKLNANKLKLSISALQRHMAMMPVLQWTEPQPDVVRPGVQEDADVDENSYERTGVTHLVHAWHPQGHKRNQVSVLHFKGGGSF
jgi:hypothetical protein